MPDALTATADGVDVSVRDPLRRFDLIASIRNQLFLPPLAYSIDGRAVSIEAPIDEAPKVGSLVVVDVDGVRLLVQVLASRIELRDGPRLRVALDELGASDATTQLRMRACAAEGAVLGIVEDEVFAPLADAVSFSETLLVPATGAEVRAYHAWVAATARGSVLDLGSEPEDSALRIGLHARGLARHTLFCGQSGSGKTFSLGVLLERTLLETTLPLLVFDPNSDHVHLGSMRTRAQAEQVRARPFDDAAWRRLETAHAAAALNVAVVTDGADARQRLQDRDYRALVYDLGGKPDATARHEAAANALEQVWASRRDREPLLIVLDEAHDLCPAEPTTDAQRRATEIVIAIAGEGRKFGRHLLLATQRPQKLHLNVVSQCDNLVLLRMNSTLDVDELAGSFSHLPHGLMRCAPSFDQGMALVGGPLVPHPVLVRIDGRLTPEGGSDVPTTWAASASGT